MFFPGAESRAFRSPLSEPILRAVPYVVVWGCLLLTLGLGGKLWDSNDDVHMAMITHGYGIVSAPSPDVVYSNVIWGWIAMHLGTPFGVEGYTVLMYAVLLASGAAMTWVLYRSEAPALVGAALLLVMYFHTLLEPQFTVTAGYAAAAGVALLCSLREGAARRMAVLGALFLSVSALLRLQELLFVCLVSAPLLAWALYRRRGDRGWRPPAAALLCSLLLVTGCKLVDMQHYSGPEWTRFKQMNQLRRPFTDYGMARYFEAHPDLLAGTGFSRDDMRMLENWFFLDDKVYSPDRLRALLQKVDVLDYVESNLLRYRSLGAPLGEIQIDLLLTLLVVALVASRNRAAAACGLLFFLAAVAVFLMLGRAWATRVYPGPLAALAVLCLLEPRRWRLPLLPLTGLAVAGIAVYNAWTFLHWRMELERRVEATQRGICTIPAGELQVSWGETSGFADRFIYTPRLPPGGRCPLTLYPIGVLELYPATLAQLYQSTGDRSFVEALLAGQHFNLLTSDDHIELLRRYVQQHYGATLAVAEGEVMAFGHPRVVSVAARP